MSNQQSNSGSIAIGGRTSGEAGATPDHETMAETGGSGGDALTQPKDIEVAPLTGERQPGEGNWKGGNETAEGAGSAATAIGRGYQDTRGNQAGPGETGLGTPETGGNQDEGDLAPPR